MTSDRNSSETSVNHPDRVILDPTNRPVVSPIYQSVKFTLKDYAELEGVFQDGSKQYFYSRTLNPTVRELELTLAKLQNREDAVALSSGMAAISSALLSLLKTGDHVCLFTESYKPSRIFIRTLLAKFGIEHSVLSIDDHSALERELAMKHSKIVLFESPTNPMLKLADIECITQLAHAAGALSVLDNTFAGFHNHGQYPVDLYLHSLTKFASGHGDVMGGVVIGDEKLLKNIRADSQLLGGVLDPHAAYLIQRGMKTYFVRHKKQCENATFLAEKLASHPKISKVFYPGLESDPGHHLAKKQMHDFGALLAFNLKCDEPSFKTFFNQLKLIQSAASLGSTETLIAPAGLFFAGDLSPSEKQNAGITATTARLAVGIEDPHDLFADFVQALES